MYLIGAGDFLDSIGKLVNLENPMIMAPAAFFPKVSTPKIANLVEDMLSTQGKHSYASLSEVAHRNAVTLIVTATGASTEDPTSLVSVLAQAIHANMVALIAAQRAAELWSVRPDGLDYCVQLRVHLLVDDGPEFKQEG